MSSSTSEPIGTTKPISDFLARFEIYDVDPSGLPTAVTDEDRLQSLVHAVASGGLPEVVTDRSKLPDGIAAVLIFPIYRDGEIVSVVALAASDDSSALGVFEVWEPVDAHDEVRLAKGYYSSLERFQNVSTFVRFEKGSGLPGTVWDRHRAVVHNDLPNHPGFLRAAGASAEALTTAVGIPIFDDEFVASVVLISSAKSPLARGVEIWAADGDGFVLIEGAYTGLADHFVLTAGTRLSGDAGLPGLAASRGGASVTDSPACYAAGRTPDAGPMEGHRGLALPCYDGSVLTSVVVLLF